MTLLLFIDILKMIDMTGNFLIFLFIPFRMCLILHSQFPNRV